MVLDSSTHYLSWRSILAYGSSSILAYGAKIARALSVLEYHGVVGVIVIGVNVEEDEDEDEE